MNVIEKNEGPKLAYTAAGNVLTLGDGEIALRLDKFERDTDVTIYVVRDDGGILATSIGDSTEGKCYAAEIFVPARQYIEIEGPAVDEQGEEVRETTREPLPFDMDRVTLTLWALL